MNRCLSILWKTAAIGFVWELLAIFSPAQSGVPHFWNAATSIDSFARFGNFSGNTLAAGVKVLIGESMRTLIRALLGMGLGAVGGYALGAAVLMLPGWQAVPVKAIASLRAVPPLALVFLLVFLSPRGEGATVAYIAICVALLVSGTLHDTRHYLPEPLLQQVRHLGGKRWHQLKDVAAPAMWDQTRQTCAWACQLLLPLSFGAELINSQSGGLGALGYQAFLYANLPQLMILAVIYIALGQFITPFVSHLITPHPIPTHSTS